MEEERVVRARVLDQPVHGPQYVLLGWLAHGILLVVREDDHILALVPKLLDQVGRHIPDVVDASPQLAALAKVIDADQQGFPPAVALRVLEGVALRVAIAEGLGRRGRLRRVVGVGIWRMSCAWVRVLDVGSPRGLYVYSPGLPPYCGWGGLL